LLIAFLHMTDMSPLWLIPGYGAWFNNLVIQTPYGLTIYMILFFIFFGSALILGATMRSSRKAE
jgi:hypothetical protein